MHPRRKRKLKTILLILAITGLAVGLVLFSLRQNISLFYSPTQLANETIPAHQVIRVGGVVVPGSVIRSAEDNLTVRFKVTDYQHTIAVTYRGVLPDLFREGQGIVTRGELVDNQHFHAVEVLAKHNEKYMPPEVKDSIKHGIALGGSTEPRPSGSGNPLADSRASDSSAQTITVVKKAQI